MSICFVCEKDQAVKDNMCGICLCYRFGLRAIETEKKRKASEFERKLTYVLLGLAIFSIVAYRVWLIW